MEARAVLGATQRERWIANTLAGLAEIAVLRGDEQRAVGLLAATATRPATTRSASRT